MALFCCSISAADLEIREVSQAAIMERVSRAVRPFPVHYELAPAWEHQRSSADGRFEWDKESRCLHFSNQTRLGKPLDLVSPSAFRNLRSNNAVHKRSRTRR